MLQLTLSDIFGRNVTELNDTIIIVKSDLAFFTVGLDTFFDVKQCLFAGIIRNLERTFNGYLLDSDLSKLIDDNGVALLYDYEQEYNELYLQLYNIYFDAGDRIYYYQYHAYNLSGNYEQNNSEFISEDVNNVYIDKTSLNLPDNTIATLMYCLLLKFQQFNMPNVVIDYIEQDEFYKLSLDAVVTRYIYQIKFTLPDNIVFDLDLI